VCSYLNSLAIQVLHLFLDATSDMASILAADASRSSAASEEKSNFLSGDSGQQRVRSLSDSRSDGQKKQSKSFLFVELSNPT